MVARGELFPQVFILLAQKSSRSVCIYRYLPLLWEQAHPCINCWFGVQCIPQWISILWEPIGASMTCPSSKELLRSPPPGSWNAAASSRGTAALRSWAGSMDSSTIARLRPKLSTSEILVSGMYAFSSSLHWTPDKDSIYMSKSKP